MADTPTVTTIAALQALDHANIPAAFLASGLLTGSFVWFGSNFATAVSNDIAKALYVPPSFGDTTGASGVWVRQNTAVWNLGWFGLVPDGNITPSIPFGPPTINSGTDNAQVLANWGTLARWFSSNGWPVTVEVPPLAPGANCILFNHNNCQLFNCCIRELYWKNNKILWQNTAAAATAFAIPWGHQARPMFGPAGAGQAVSFKIATTNLQVQILTAAYVSGTGLLTIGLGTGYEGLNLAPGSVVTVAGLSGTGAFQQANVTNFVATTGSTGNTLVIQLLASLTMTLAVPASNVYVTQGVGFIAAYPLSTGASYNPSTGVVTIGLATTMIAVVANSTLVSVTGFGGTGSFALANVTNVQVTSITNNGSPPVEVLTYVIATGLTMTLDTTNVMITQQSNAFGLTGYAVVAPVAGASYFNVDDEIIATSIDSQYGGFPSNAFQYEYLDIAAIAQVTGSAVTSLVITTVQRIRNQHRWDFPDNINTGVTVNPSAAIGAGRIWPLNSPLPFTINGLNVGIIPFKVRHRYDGLKLGCTLGAPNLSQFYASVTGDDLEYHDYEGPGDSPSIARNVRHYNPKFLAPGEPDKLVDNYVLDGIEGDSTGFGPDAGLGFQSSLNRVHIKNAKIDYVLSLGPVKHAIVETSDIASVSITTSGIGRGLSTTFDNCKIWNSNTLTAIDGAVLVTIDNSTMVWFGSSSPGTLANVQAFFPNVTSFAGIITIHIVNIGVGIGHWVVDPGMSMSFVGPTNALFTGSSAAVNGNMLVTGLCQDTTYYYILTNSRLTALPSWTPATFNLYKFHVNDVRFRNCDGFGEITMASAAEAKGLRYWEYFKYYVTGNYPTTLGFFGKIHGNITSVTINVLDAGPAAGAFVTITIPSFNSASNFATDASGGTVIKCVVGLYGQRIFSQTSLVGQQTGDAVTVGGTAGTLLPGGRVYGGSGEVTFVLSGGTAGSFPQFVVEIQMECGYTHRAQIAPQYDLSGNPNQVSAVQGQLQ